MFDSTGKLTYAPNNLLTYSNTFSNAVWSKSNVTVASGVDDPLGGTAAYTVTATAGANTAVLYNAITLPGSAVAGTTPLMQTFWVRRRTGSGVINWSALGVGVGSAMTVTGSWTQVYLVSTAPGGGTGYFGIRLSTSGDAVDIYAPALSIVTYETTPRTADQVITTAAAYYGPRIDYDPNTLAVKGLLIEEARTNLALYSQDFSNAAWTRSSATVSSPSATAPDGTATAQKLVENAGTVNPQVFNTSVFTVTNGANYSWTVFFKAAERSWGVVNAYDNAVHPTYFNLNTGTIGANAAGNTASIQAVGNGWYRCQVSRAITGTSAYAQFEISSADNTPTYTGDGTSGVYIWGAQFEAGSFATSYIPTGASSVTRAPDVVQFTGAALTALQGSAFSAIGEAQTIAAPAVQAVLFGANSGVAFVYAPGTNNQAALYDGTSLVAVATAGGGRTWSGLARAGIGVSGSTASEVMTGGTVATGSHALPARTTAYLGTYSGGAYLNGWVKSFAIYNSRLPDATLQAKSVVGASY